MDTIPDTTQAPQPDTQPTPKRRGRPPGAKDSKPRKRRKDAQAKPITQGGENLQKGGECLPVVVVSESNERIQRANLPPPQQDNKPAAGELIKGSWQEVIAEREKRLEETVKAILGPRDTVRVETICKLIRATADGKGFTKATEGLDFPWRMWSSILHAYPILQELWHTAQASGDSWRTQKLEEVTYERATDGWHEPVFHRGAIVGHVRRFSDRLAEIHLRASNPARYAPAPEERGNAQAVQVVIYTNPRGSQDATKALPDASASVETPTKA